MADDDMGSFYLKGHRSERGPSADYGGLANRKKQITTATATDMDIVKQYGKDVDLSDASEQTVNRERKGNRL